jgi:hypothetical protein
MPAPTLSPSDARAPVATTPPSQREPRPLVGDFIRHPAWIWLTHVAPIALLLAWTGHTYWLVESEMNASERSESFALALGTFAITAGAAVIATRAQRAKRLLANGECGVLLLLSLAVMAISIRFCFYTIPWTVPEWLANQYELLFEGFCLAMPGAFYAILVLAAKPLRRHGGAEFALLVAATVIGTAAFYGLMYGLRHIDWVRHLPEWIGEAAVLGGIFGGGTVVTALITRATLVAYTGVRQLSPTLLRFFMFVVAVCGPIGGLYLNKALPFPVDLQAPIIYLLALVNGGLLMLPVVRSIFWHRVIWVAQCLLFPFSAYFFLLFLPFMPLSLFAMIAIGSGFLMLVPLVLGIAHAGRLADGFREEVRDGKRWPVAVMGLAAISTLPVLGLWSAWQDRATLDEALAYIYSPDYRKDVTFPGSLPRLASSLQHLRDAKQGIFLPFLTPIYDDIVFHGLVLPDAKINDLQAAFFGTGFDKQAGALMRSRTDYRVWNETVPLGHNVALENVQTTEQTMGLNHTAQLLLTMGNHGYDQAEFSTTVHIPEGVYVTGFALKIGNDFVPARIVEKKTALWVYEKITQIHRDPGILTFTSRTDLNLRVAPFNSGEIRQARLDLVYAGDSPVSVTIGDATVHLGGNANPVTPLSVTSCVTDAGSVAIADVAKVSDWQIKRTPYLDILIDCSRGTSYSAASLAQAIQQARQAFPEATMARVTAINFEARDLVPDLVAIDQLNVADLSAKLLPKRGGLLEDRFFKRGLLLAHDLMQAGVDQAKMRPQFVLISSIGQPGQREDRLEDFLRLAPDARVIFAQDGNGYLGGVDLVSRAPATIGTQPPVVLWQWGGHFAVSVAGSRLVAAFPGGEKSSSPQIYDPQRQQFTAVPDQISLPPDSHFADGVRTWAAEDEAEFDPQLLANGAAALIGLSKQTGILIPDSSYIAVESLSQWRVMEEKEKQKLHNKQVFEIEEPVATPEPATWVMLIFGLVMICLVRRRARKC